MSHPAPSLPADTTGPAHLGPVIDVAGLHMTYPKATEAAVRGMDFSVPRGEIFGFLGPSGAGKSTTQKILTGLLYGYQGTARLWGRSPARWGSELYRHVGVSFELPNHYRKLTALENLRFFAALHDRPTRDPMELLDMVGLAPAAHTRVGAFSKGMAMRLGFVRALLHDPALLFLDEPTSGLDPSNARTVRDIVVDLRSQGKTVFLTTHDMPTADELCDRVAFVVDGRIVAIDSPRELKVARSRRQVTVEYRDHDGTVGTAEFALDGLGDNPDFQRVLRERKVETVHSQEADLDDVFVETTGRSLR